MFLSRKLILMSNATYYAAMCKARVALINKKDATFFATLAMSIHFKWNTEIPVARTNGVEIQYNPEFFMSLSLEERQGLILHEICHIIFDHCGRFHGFEKKRLNQSQDHYINLMITERGFKIPSGGCCDHKFKGMSVKEIYDLLPTDPPEDDFSDICPDMPNDDEGSNHGKSLSQAEVQKFVKDAVIRANIASHQAKDETGSIPGEISMALDKMMNPKLPWQVILRKFLSEISKNAYTWKRPNKRFMPNMYLPSLHSEGLSDFAAFTDISGSVTDKAYSHQVHEIANVFKMLKPKKITFGQFDTKIISIDQVKTVHELLNIDFHGRGGTDFTDVLHWVNKNKPKFALILSDGDCHVPNIKPLVPVIWLIYNNPRFTAPYGKVIHYSIDEY